MQSTMVALLSRIHLTRVLYVAARVVNASNPSSFAMARPTKYTTLDRTRRLINSGMTSISA